MWRDMRSFLAQLPSTFIDINFSSNWCFQLKWISKTTSHQIILLTQLHPPTNVPALTGLKIPLWCNYNSIWRHRTHLFDKKYKINCCCSRLKHIMKFKSKCVDSWCERASSHIHKLPIHNAYAILSNPSGVFSAFLLDHASNCSNKDIFKRKITFQSKLWQLLNLLNLTLPRFSLLPKPIMFFFIFIHCTTNKRKLIYEIYQKSARYNVLDA